MIVVIQLEKILRRMYKIFVVYAKKSRSTLTTLVS